MATATDTRELIALRRLAATRTAGGARPIHRVSTFAGGFGDGTAWNDEVPGPRLELVLELDGRWEIELGGRMVTRRAFIGGPLVGRVRTRAGDRVRLVQLSIDPLDAPAVLGIPAGELQGEVADLEAVLGAEGEQLLSRLDQAWRGPDGGAAAAGVATQWVAERQSRSHPDRSAPADVRLAAAMLEASSGRASIESVARTLGCSRRHLARRFDTWIGTAPSEHLRLLRLDRATTALRDDPSAALGPLAAHAGYADHSHMVRDFHALVGMTPSAFAARGAPPG